MNEGHTHIIRQHRFWLASLGIVIFLFVVSSFALRTVLDYDSSLCLVVLVRSVIPLLSILLTVAFVSLSGRVYRSRLLLLSDTTESMHEGHKRKIRRRIYLLVSFGIVISCLVFCISVMRTVYDYDSSSGWIVLFQCVIPMLSILLAGFFVSLPGRIVRSKILLLPMFMLLLCFGIIVNAHLKEGGGGWVKTILLPFNTTLGSFFPSRGEYGVCNIEEGWQVPYLFFHSLTYFYAAWLGLSLFGRQLLNRTALAFMRYSKKNLIWGYSEGAEELAKDMIVKTFGDEPVFIIDDDIEFDSERENKIFDRLSNSGIIAVSTHFENLSVNPQDFARGWYNWRYWRRMLSSGKYFGGYRHYFITENQDFNVKYALIVLRQLYLQRESLSHKTHLFVRSELEGVDAFLQKELDPSLEGKVEVHVFNQSDITARQFVEHHPVLDLEKRVNPVTRKNWLTINYDNLHVSGEINILILGLGWTGFEMLKKQVCDAQFIGDYSINVTVIDNDYANFHGRYQYIVQEAARFGINICINPLVWIDDKHRICRQWLGNERCFKKRDLEEKRVCQANSDLFYEWLGFEEPGAGAVNIIRFNRIIVALGSDELNVNTALQMTRFRNCYLGTRESNDALLMPEPIFAHVRDRERYSYYESYEDAPITIFGGLKNIYSVATLVDEKMDFIAKLVNYVYCRYDILKLTMLQLIDSINQGDSEKEWAKCSIFNQDSSRAVAMNLNNISRLAGGVEKFADIFSVPDYCEYLSELEHKRWNAFHYMNGIRTWTMDEVEASTDDRGRIKPKGKLYFNGNLVRHICLVGYDLLDAATRKVQELGNSGEDFRATDKRIISHFFEFMVLERLLSRK